MNIRKKHGRIIFLMTAAAILILTVSGYATAHLTEENRQITLTDEEQRYITDHPEVSIAIDTSWIPYGFLDADETCTGIIPNMMDMAAERAGLNVRFISKNTYEDAIKACTSGETMLVSGIADDPDMAEKNDILITDPYITIGYSAVTKKKISDLYAEGANYRVALCLGTYAKVAMQKKMPSYEFVEYHSNKECLDAVLKNEADIALVANYSAGYFATWHEYRKLQTIQINDFNWELCFGVNKDTDPLLIEILNKSIANISENDVNQAIYSGATEAATSLHRPVDVLYEQPVLVAVSAGLVVALITSMIFVVKDQRKKAYAEVNERSRKELQESSDIAEAARTANESKTEFFSRMSHDMRTPMNGILGIAELSMDEDDPVILKQNIVKIETSGKYLLGLINDTLDFQRIESGKLQLEPEIVNCNEIVQSILDMVRATIEKKKIDFQVINHNVVLDCFIKADPVRMKQIFLNLISNAIKFTPEGGKVTFEYECMDRQDMISCDRFIVRDTGVGMSEDFIKNKIFQPFSQEHNAVSGQYAGSGLGLSIVKKLVDLMGGSISVESELGVGTTFMIYLDIERVNEEEVAKETEHMAKKQTDVLHSLDGCHVLLAEDHPLNAEIAKKLLEKVGCIVNWAKDGQECLEVFKHSQPHQFDVILMDIRMPVMDGLTSTKAIRALKREDAASIPIIAMTANAYEEDIRKSMEAGMNAHLSKPIDPAKMYETMAEFMVQP